MMKQYLKQYLILILSIANGILADPCDTICEVSDWPSEEALGLFGQLSGIDLDQQGNPVVFHRGDRIWDQYTFNDNDVYIGPNYPIPNDTIGTLSSSTGELLHSWGSDLFFMPHMLTVDLQGNVWVTDVALHQVFKFKNGNWTSPSLILGTRFEPGNDDTHYCKPTSIAVTSDNRYFYVADGYCNGRIIKYELIDNNGVEEAEKVLEWGHKGVSAQGEDYFKIPHSLALMEDLRQICVADREHGRIQCFDMDTGEFIRSMEIPQVGSTVYGIDYAQYKGLGRIYAVSGPELQGVISPSGFVFDVHTGQLIEEFNADNGFQRPHDVVVTTDGANVYEIELAEPYRVVKFVDNRPFK